MFCDVFPPSGDGTLSSVPVVTVERLWGSQEGLLQIPALYSVGKITLTLSLVFMHEVDFPQDKIVLLCGQITQALTQASKV